MTAARWFWLAVAAFTLTGALLRLEGIHDPIFDHPGWRQGDTAAIARNFAQLQYDPFYPQTDYNGPPPNYVELELQIVPFLAATLYKLFGVHEIFGRLISLAFGVATIPVVGAFARWLFARTPPASSATGVVAGVAAAAAYAVFPGAWYYSHTFMPDTTMTFFTTCALFACARWLVGANAGGWRGWWAPALLLTVAFLAKPVAVTAAIPIAAVALTSLGRRRALTSLPLWLLFVVPFAVLAAYDHAVSSHAEWHWASGITRLHVLPSLRAALTSPHAFADKAVAFAHAFKLLGTTMLGPLGAVLALAGFCVPPRSRANALLWGWLAGGLLYAYVVVTVERVDYYLYLLLPLAALVIGRLCAYAYERWVPMAAAPRGMLPEAAADAGVTRHGVASAGIVDADDARASAVRRDRRRLAFAGLAALVWMLMIAAGYREIRPYYAWSKANFAHAKALDATLAPGALVVMGHYDPSILYTIGRKGWEEDPHLWTPFDEQSAIRKGARYFISVEHARLKQTNLELYCWLDRFPVLDPAAKWPVYETDPAKVLPGAEERWRSFRKREMAGAFANWRREWTSAPDPCR